MPAESSPGTRLDKQFFVDKYSRLQSGAARQVEREVLGQEVGLNGFTTIEQAEALVEVLELRPGQRLLDVGAGQGWPGHFLAEASGCRLVCTDIPLTGLIAANEILAERGLADRSTIVGASALGLPFTSTTFDAIAHADVFC